MPAELAWAIFLLPFSSFVVVSFLSRPYPKVSGYVAIASIGASLLLSLWAFQSLLAAPGHFISVPPVKWAAVGPVVVDLSLILDSLTGVMLIVVSGVSLLVQIYSQGYMHGDPGYSRYFAFMSLFTGAMLGLVLAGNLLLLYVFWEMVGLCSYLLIGFWFARPAAAAAAKKAFIVTRLGDLGFLIAILALFRATGTFDIAQLREMALAGSLGGIFLTWVALGIFSGAMGKSAQFPLHVWLPDAMEGPTPVSALIHAATMVAAGVYLVSRLFPLFAHSLEAMTTVAIIGGFTALFAATMGLVMNDMKRVMAYSTISQLGYMMLGLGVGGYVAGIFHLFNHAFFKALLFLCAGSANHATGTFDIREMGGLRRFMPITFWTILVASLSLAGLFPFSGFWSKDEILADTLRSSQSLGPLLFAMALGTVFLTAFYMFRVVYVAFGGEYRGGGASEHGHSPSLHESPAVMAAPLILLAIPSVISGFVNPPPFFSVLGLPAHWLGDFLNASLPAALVEHGAAEFDLGLASLSTLFALGGIFMAHAVYGAKWLSSDAIARQFSPIYTLFARKYWFDEFYQALVDRILLGLSYLLDLFDRHVVDGVVNGVGGVTFGAGGVLRRIETGQVQAYGLVIFLGVIAIMAAFLIFGG